MSSVIQPQLQNSTSDFNSSGGPGYFDVCDDMMEGVLAWAGFSVVAFLLGVPACIAIFWEQKHRKSRANTPNDVFMINLTLMDVVYLAFVPMSLCNWLSWHIWLIEIFCNFFYAMNLTGRPLLMTCMSLDCYMAVVHPVTYHLKKGLSSRVLLCVGVWTVTVACGVAFLFKPNLFYSPIFIFFYLISTLTIGLCDINILMVLKTSDPGGQDIHPQKKKAYQIIINSLVVTVIAYLPPIIGYSFQWLFTISDQVFTCKICFPVMISTTAGSTVMPILYWSNQGKLDRLRLFFQKRA